MRAPLREVAQGRWRGILPALGLPPVLLNGKHGACPICGGKERFRFDDKEGRGTWICNQCGAGDGISFVMRMQGCDFKAAVERIEPLVGLTPPSLPRSGPTEDDCRRWRNETWAGARPISGDDAAGRFLQARAGVLSYPRSLRFHPSLEHRTRDGRRSKHPAMLAMVMDPSGRAANIHRTYLTGVGGKAAVDRPRLMMSGTIPDGAAVRLFEPAEELGIAEGIETAFAASALWGVPCWSAMNATMLAKWRPPDCVRRVVIFGDNDSNFTGQRAAYDLANRLAGREGLQAEVRIPDQIGADWNDVLITSSVRKVA